MDEEMRTGDNRTARLANRPRSFFVRQLADLPIPKKLGLIIGIFLLVIFALLSISYFGMAVLSDVRAYVGGEGLWSKAQKDAVYHLMRYAIFREEDDYVKYSSYLAVPMGDRKARLALEQAPIDFKTVESGFIEGRNNPRDVAGMARLFKHFYGISYIHQASDAWREADGIISELLIVGDDVHKYVRTGEPDSRKMKELLRRIDNISERLTPIEDRFSYTLGEGARWLKATLMGVMLAVTGILLLLGLLMAIVIARWLANEIDRLRNAAAQVAKGNFTLPINVESADEIGDLARSFEEMAKQRQKAEAVLSQRAKELADVNSRLIETEKAKDNFLATVSHELRSPLTLVLSPIESLLAGEYGLLTDAQKSLVQMMHNNAVRLLQMVTGLLDFSKLEAGRMEVKREPMELIAATRSMLQDFEPIMKQKGLKGRLEASVDEAVVLMDRYLYERIVFNLLSNAVKFTPQGGRITVQLSWSEGLLQLIVQDTGIGISEADMGQLFQKFHQLEGVSTRRFEGTGLGLALVKQFITLLEGDVSVDSVAGAGSAFRVTCAAPAVSLTELDAAQMRKGGTQPIQRFAPSVDGGAQTAAPSAMEGCPKVLVAEDNLELAWYIAALLRNSCQVTIARDGEEALEMVGKVNPDLVISDVMMPRRDGLSLCMAIKRSPATSGIPVILLTALTHRNALLKGWEAGADEYLFKPFHPKELVGRVASMLANLQRRKQVEEERGRIFSLSLDLLCIADFDFQFRQLNSRWEQVVGFTESEMRSRSCLEFIHPHDRGAFRAQADKLSAGHAVLAFECRFLCKDGTYRWLLWNATPLPEQKLIYAAARDITERIQAEQQLKRAHTDLKKSHEELKEAQLQLIQSAKMESVGRLAAGVAHEVKNPLAVILQGVDYLSKHLPQHNGNGKTPIVLKHTENAVHRADAVLRGLLDFSTTRELELAPIDINKTIEQALMLVKHEIDCAHILLVRRFSEALPKALADKNKIEQVLVNLLMNAVHAMPEGGKLTVSTRAAQLNEVGPEIGARQEDHFRIGETVVIAEVEDTGTGIPEEWLEKIFDPFFTTKPTGKGTGLGLTVARKIIELHRGVIMIRNRSDREGVRATLFLKTDGGDHGEEARTPD